MTLVPAFYTLLRQRRKHTIQVSRWVHVLVTVTTPWADVAMHTQLLRDVASARMPEIAAKHQKAASRRLHIHTAIAINSIAWLKNPPPVWVLLTHHSRPNPDGEAVLACPEDAHRVRHPCTPRLGVPVCVLRL